MKETKLFFKFMENVILSKQYHSRHLSKKASIYKTKHKYNTLTMVKYAEKQQMKVNFSIHAINPNYLARLLRFPRGVESLDWLDLQQPCK